MLQSSQSPPRPPPSPINTLPCAQRSCYRLKLFLEKFSIPSAVLNAELPANSRLHCLQQFNKVGGPVGVMHPAHRVRRAAVGLKGNPNAVLPNLLQGIFDYLIATDESVGRDPAEEGEEGEDADADESRPRKRTSKKKGAAVEADGDFNVARGVDFKGVATVINVDMPSTAAAYTHRIGRTARAGASGESFDPRHVASAWPPSVVQCTNHAGALYLTIAPTPNPPLPLLQECPSRF